MKKKMSKRWRLIRLPNDQFTGGRRPPSCPSPKSARRHRCSAGAAGKFHLFFPCWKFQFFEAREIQDTDFILVLNLYLLCICAQKLPQGHRPKHSWKGIDVESCADSIAPVIPCLSHHLLYLCPVCVLEACAIHCMPWLLKHQFLNRPVDPFPCRHCSPRMTPLNTQFQKVIYILTIPRFRLGSSYFDQTFTIGDPGLDDAKICRNPLYFMVKTTGSQFTFPSKPIH